MKLDSLYSRIALVFAAVLIAFGMALGWLSYSAAKFHQQDVMQQLSRGLADHIASHEPLMTANGIDRKAMDELFHMATAVNPSIEIYLLDPEGLILAHSPPPGELDLDRVSFAPIRAFMSGRSLPIVGDNPRNAGRQDVFSVAAIERRGRTAGFLYIVLLGDMYRQMVDDARLNYVLRSAVWTAAAALGLAMLVGLAAFAWITRPLNALTRSVQAFENGDHASRMQVEKSDAIPTDEIGRLSRAFANMTDRLAAQMKELQRQDDLRRELVANISHDLRTPLTSMQNYLETLARMGESLSALERQHYLEVAVRQSHRVAKLAQQLFELALLECAETQPQPEVFLLSELVQDIAQKFALATGDKGVSLTTHLDPKGLFVCGDIGMIERVFTNLIDNAIRYTLAGGQIRIEAARAGEDIRVQVADTGVGIAAEYLPGLFLRTSPLRNPPERGNGGLGLLIANRILTLHGARIAVVSELGRGTSFSFALPAAGPG